TPEFMFAARLAAFANLPIGEPNWRSLWKYGGYVESRIPLWTLPGAQRLAHSASFRKEAEARAGQVPGELWRAFVDDAFRSVLAGRRIVETPSALGAVGPWSDRGLDGPIDYEGLRDEHRTTRRYLQRICGDEDVRGVVRALGDVDLRLAVEMEPVSWRRDQ